MSKSNRVRIMLLGGVALWLGAGAAQAQVAADSADDAAGGLQEIVVTAQKRAQNIQQVGIAITAVTPEQIANRNIASSADLAGKVVGLESYSPYGPGTSSNVVIRGIGLNDFGEGHEAPVTSYVDEFYIVAVPAVDFALFDLDRVEVLRGPQGTLFGRNSTGGLINYITKRPSQTAEGYLSASYGRFNDLKLEGAATAPLSDTVSMRLSGTSRHSDGFQKNINPALERGGQAGSDAARLQLRYQGDDGWDILLKGEYGRTRTTHAYYESKTGFVDANGLVVTDPTIVDAVGYAERNTPAAKKNVVSTNDAAFLRSSGYSGLLRIEKKFGDTTFTSLTGYQSYKRRMQEDSDGTPNPLVFASFPYQGKQLTQELRLYHDGRSTRWTVGLYGMRALGKDQPTAVFNFPLDGPTAVNPATGLYNGTYFPISLNADWRLRTNSGAVFGQIEQDFGKFTAIAGIRVTRDRKTFSDRDNAALRDCGGGAVGDCFLVSDGGTGTPVPFRLKYSATLWSGKIELDYKPNRNNLFYASISRGTKAGGFNNGFYPTGVSLARIPYGDETLISYEVGQKSTLFDRKLRINTSAFYYDYKDYQAFNYVGLAGLITNQDATAYGIETDIEAAVTPELRLYAAGAYLHTEIEDVAKVTPVGTTVVADRPMAFAPKWSASGGATYTIELPNDQSLALDWNFETRSSRYSGNFGDPGTQLEGYFKHNASITYEAAEHWQLRAFVDNISNRLNTTYGGPSFASLGIIQVRYAMPRTYGAAVRYRW
ncbi:TonB-dependent receptor [Sphingomonas histidinilytica]|jgi:outer membrane receptor protein involved in Fe transport|uniref:Outer membrane receptor proteins, mostly Fe transport n=1 Tax=Rhizorhabdus histidinilytica TaxID=439228 RepID=A0A1T5AT60_9SPHN|nr:TonB-dependent receptor [Rhizorhabdus histidinilytica]MBO9378159.1 TonB-dependent receptor [Rhizorhabdus histidinilytica]QEH79627.1 TonB-dependent receptor [Sphingomonas sp. C8-2]SKB38221.1 Outer membrane receptor proteins, mostly Fe transport [Rhizorhabdus histidinilytica]